ncbi:ABC transporter permease [Tessaracoccus rhinocerotis]|uniref:ABC transporter permease n=1 Tax=Tessaracoccus rhinocerotis TaxID=1689449 RepID=A0A553JYF0_9ACTN|nr:ABC transporter permease [Tessaracoccus rhinocerotis]TRY17479.1 ABC transporter permease [Tessaracoccus rhinocerotis]
MKHSSLAVGGLLIGLIVATAVVGLFWMPFDPNALVGPRLQAPGWPHVLGTDAFGGDIASRIIDGAKRCLLIGVVSVLGAGVVGIPVGVVAGMSRSWFGDVLARAADILYGFPALLLAILFAAALGGSTWTAMAAIAIATVPAFVRIARAATMQVMGLGFVEAAQLSGTPTFQVALRHVLPNIAPVLGVQASVSVGLAILAEAGLSYLGLGSGQDEPTWGRMLREAQDQLFNAPLIALWPGLAIALATLGFNLLGDGLRDFLDPRLREIA